MEGRRGDEGEMERRRGDEEELVNSNLFHHVFKLDLSCCGFALTLVCRLLAD